MSQTTCEQWSRSLRRHHLPVPFLIPLSAQVFLFLALCTFQSASSQLFFGTEVKYYPALFQLVSSQHHLFETSFIQR